MQTWGYSKSRGKAECETCGNLRCAIAQIHPTVIRISDPRSRKSRISSSGTCCGATTDPILYRHEDHRQAGADASLRASPPIGVNMDGLNTNSAR